MAITQSLIDSFICPGCGELFGKTIGGVYIGCPNWEHGGLRRKPALYDAVVRLLACAVASKISEHPVRFEIDGHGEAVFKLARRYRRKQKARPFGLLVRVKYGHKWWRRRLVREVPECT